MQCVKCRNAFFKGFDRDHDSHAELTRDQREPVSNVLVILCQRSEE